MSIQTSQPFLRFITLFLVFFGVQGYAKDLAGESSWRVGTGREIITPAAGVWTTGYAARTHPAEGTAQDLWVKALAFCDPAGNRGVLITLDLCGITREITTRVASELEQRHGLSRSAVMVNVSHTHCSP